MAYIDRFTTEASRLLTRCRGVGKHFSFLKGGTGPDEIEKYIFEQPDWN